MAQGELPSKEIQIHNGEALYKSGLQRLAFVRNGDFEGRQKIWRKRALRLLSFHDTLTDKRKSRIISWLGAKKYSSTEDALKAMKTKKKDMQRS